MVCRSVFVGALATVLAVTPAIAAEGQAKLTAASGRVLVNQGDGYTQVSPGKLLNTGDSIFIGDESAATITYVADNCEVAVNTPRVHIVGALSPCQAKAVQVEPAADLPDIEEDVKAEVPPPFPVGLLVAGAVVGACVIFCDEIFDNDRDDDDEEPITPPKD